VVCQRGAMKTWASPAATASSMRAKEVHSLARRLRSNDTTLTELCLTHTSIGETARGRFAGHWRTTEERWAQEVANTLWAYAPYRGAEGHVHDVGARDGTLIVRSILCCTLIPLALGPQTSGKRHGLPGA
jgi:hypothetical protein